MLWDPGTMVASRGDREHRLAGVVIALVVPVSSTTAATAATIAPVAHAAVAAAPTNPRTSGLPLAATGPGCRHPARAGDHRRAGPRRRQGTSSALLLTVAGRAGQTVPGPAGLTWRDPSQVGPIGVGPRDAQLDVRVFGRAGLPTGGQVGAVVLNVTITNPDSAGYVSVFPTGSQPPNAFKRQLPRRPDQAQPGDRQGRPERRDLADHEHSLDRRPARSSTTTTARRSVLHLSIAQPGLQPSVARGPRTQRSVPQGRPFG